MLRGKGQTTAAREGRFDRFNFRRACNGTSLISPKQCLQHSRFPMKMQNERAGVAIKLKPDQVKQTLARG